MTPEEFLKYFHIERVNRRAEELVAMSRCLGCGTVFETDLHTSNLESVLEKHLSECSAPKKAAAVQE